MARARKKKAKPARKRVAKRRKAPAKQSGDNTWQIGAGVLALAVMLGAAIYAVTLTDGPRTSVAELVEKFEVPQSVKEFPETVRQNLPELPAMTNSPNETANDATQESAPAE